MSRHFHDEQEPIDKETMRLDKWLWAARFFKTRALATEAINGGKIHLNGQRAKPGKDIGIGARLEISKDQYTWDITITALKAQRRPAAEAALRTDYPDYFIQAVTYLALLRTVAPKVENRDPDAEGQPIWPSTLDLRISTPIPGGITATRVGCDSVL